MNASSGAAARTRARFLRAGLLASAALLCCCLSAAAQAAEATKFVVVLYPDNDDGSPGGALFDQSVRSTLITGSSARIEIHNEHLDVSPSRDDGFKKLQVEFLRRKYAGRKVDLVITGLSSALNYSLTHRDEIFPGVPIVFAVVDEKEVKALPREPGVIGVPVRFDLAATLDLALQLHPNTQRVIVVAGKAKFDTYWEAEARRSFRAYEDRVEFVYLTGLPLNDLLNEVAALPDDSIIYYLHVFQDGTDKVMVPAEVLTLLSARANAPIYGNFDSYVGRGIVGGRVCSFEMEGRNAANLGLRILAGEKPEQLGVQEPSANSYMFDSRQLQRWSIRESSLPPGSEVRYKQLDFWEQYKWHIIGVVGLCLFEALLIAGLLVQRANRQQAEAGLRESQSELRVLTGRLLLAQETERRRIARELHDDLNQGLALLAVELDLLGQQPAESAGQLGGQLRDLSAQVKQLSSSVHALSHQLHPAKLEQLGLVTAVRGLCRELTQGHGTPIDFSHARIPAAIPEDVVLCLYRIVQECLGNVIKHSGARQAKVEMSGTADAICLRIADDGAGFDLALASRDGGLGLVSIRERLRLVQGELAIESRSSDGTRINVRIPLISSGTPGDDLEVAEVRIG